MTESRVLLPLQLQRKALYTEERKAAEPETEEPELSTFTVRLASRVAFQSNVRRSADLKKERAIEVLPEDLLANISEYLSIQDRLMLGNSSYALRNRFPLFPYTQRMGKRELDSKAAVQATSDKVILKNLIKDLNLLGPSIFETLHADEPNCIDRLCENRLGLGGCFDFTDSGSAFKLKTCFAFNSGGKCCMVSFLSSCPVIAWQFVSHGIPAGADNCTVTFISASISSVGSWICAGFVCCLYLKANGTFEKIEIHIAKKEANIEPTRTYLGKVSSFFQEMTRAVKKPVAPEASRGELRLSL